MAAVGKILRFDEVRGYGFIAPSAGGEDVFVHINDLGDQRHLVRPGMQVEYEVEEGDRGLKVASVRVLDPVTPVATHATARPEVNGEPRPKVSADDDDGMCDVLAPREFAADITDLLVRHVPTLTGAQIVQIRERLVEYVGRHGWVET